MRSRPLLPLSLCLLASALCPAQTPSGAAAASAASASAHRSCPITHTTPSPGDQQLAEESYTSAEASYRAQIAADASSEDAHLGLVRALLGEDKVTEAKSVADAMLTQNAKSAVAEIAQAETAYRSADINGTLTHSRAALADNPCEGRADGALAIILELNGYYGQESKYLDQAHRLRPDDELIRRDWISSLPRKQREVEISHYLEGTHNLSDEQTLGYNNALTHLKARRPGECRVTSKAESTKLPLAPIFGDHPYPVAFGLDVLYNNTKRRMQIDTGASGIVLTESAARTLKLDHEFAIKTGGVGDEGKRDSYLAHVHSIRIGDVELTDCMVEVVSKTKLDVDGLIGMDVFNRWLVTLNYADAQMQLNPLPPRPGASAAEATVALDDTGDDDTPKDRYIAPEMKDWGKIFRIGHNILLPAFAHQNSPLHYLIMDTGASATSLSVPMGRELGKLHGSPTEFYGISGKVNKVYETDTTPLFVENLGLPPAWYYAYDMTNLSHDLGFETSGLLGLPTLQRLTIQIDYRDNLLKLTYDPKKDVIRF